MKEYRPKGRILKAMLTLEEEGAMASTDLTAKIGASDYTLNALFEYAVKHGVIGHQHRVRDGRRHTFWHITPKGLACLDAVRLAEGGAP